MKSITMITSALLALGLISTASASGTFGTTNVVYITGSTAFRANLYNTMTNQISSDNLFDTAPTLLAASSASVNNGTSVYNAYGRIGGTPFVLSVSLTGSEAGVASIVNNTLTYTVPANSEMTGGPTVNGTSVTLAGTPKPTFLDPAALTASVTVAPDFAFADTSITVSLSASQSANVKEYGVVGVIPFIWAKGYNSTPDSSWSDLANVSEYQLESFFNNQNLTAFLTGSTSDLDPVYLIGRNEGSGTRVNTLCDQFKVLSVGITQFAPSWSTYGSGGNVLTAPSETNGVTKFTTAPLAGSGFYLANVGNDGFDSGSGVQKTLNIDINNLGFVTIAYLGLADGANLFHPTTATVGGGATSGQVLTLDGVVESDLAIETGTYAFWGHEHLYGQKTPTAAATSVITKLIGSNGPQTSGLGASSFTGNGSIEAAGLLSSGGGPNGASIVIDPVQMFVDRPSDGDTSYPAPF